MPIYHIEPCANSTNYATESKNTRNTRYTVKLPHIRHQRYNHHVPPRDVFEFGNRAHKTWKMTNKNWIGLGWGHRFFVSYFWCKQVKCQKYLTLTKHISAAECLSFAPRILTKMLQLNRRRNLIMWNSIAKLLNAKCACIHASSFCTVNRVVLRLWLLLRFRSCGLTKTPKASEQTFWVTVTTVDVSHNGHAGGASGLLCFTCSARVTKWNSNL